MSKKVRELAFAEDGQMYAQVTKMLGHCRVLAKTDTDEIKCKIRGSMQKRVYINPGDWVLVATRDISDCSDIIAKYDPAEVAYLKRIGEIRERRVDDDADDDAVVFADDVNVDDL
jgi:translation initiation factor 1A